MRLMRGARGRNTVKREEEHKRSPDRGFSGRMSLCYRRRALALLLDPEGQRWLRCFERELKYGQWSTCARGTAAGSISCAKRGAVMLKNLEERSQLSATEGADQVAERYGRSEAALREGGDPGYMCEACGASEFSFVERTVERETVSEVLPCECGCSDEAACRRAQTEEHHRHVFVLNDEHRAEKLNPPEMTDSFVGDKDEAVLCRYCTENAEEADWTKESEREQIDVRYEVRCSRCDHEVEFGWSHEGRGGRIWPCESADFNPWLSWPEPRFVEDWARRGWLRPDPGSKNRS